MPAQPSFTSLEEKSHSSTSKEPNRGGGFSQCRSTRWSSHAITGFRAHFPKSHAPGLLILVALYLAINISVMLHSVRNPQLAEKMQEKDSSQYVEIAREFAQGDLSMSYVQFRPHRQPLYPLCLAPAIKLFGGNLIALASVNMIIGLALLFIAYFGAQALFSNRLLSFLSGLGVISSAFMIDKIARRLMSEPSHALLLTGSLLCFLQYARTGRRNYLLGASVAAGLDYLARANGLFVASAMFCFLLSYDLFPLFSRGVRGPMPDLRRLAANYGFAVLIFIALTTPSWVPRVYYFGDPLHHGYMVNFLWVDSYEQAHTGLPTGNYHLSDYASTHDFASFLHRWRDGFYHVFYDAPRHMEPVRFLYFFALAGVVFAFAERNIIWSLLAGFLFLQILPLVWTSMANPGPRVPYGSLFPFELFFAVFCLSRIRHYAFRLLEYYAKPLSEYTMGT